MLTRLFLLSPFLFGACSHTSTTPLPTTLSSSRNEACQQELQKSISTLIHAQELEVSSDIFTHDAYLYLNNNKHSPLQSSPIFNDIWGKKTLLLYKENYKLYIGLLKKDKKIKKSIEIKKCKE